MDKSFNSLLLLFVSLFVPSVVRAALNSKSSPTSFNFVSFRGRVEFQRFVDKKTQNLCDRRFDYSSPSQSFLTDTQFTAGKNMYF